MVYRIQELAGADEGGQTTSGSEAQGARVRASQAGGVQEAHRETEGASRTRHQEAEDEPRGDAAALQSGLRRASRELSVHADLAVGRAAPGLFEQTTSRYTPGGWARHWLDCVE